MNISRKANVTSDRRAWQCLSLGLIEFVTAAYNK